MKKTLIAILSAIALLVGGVVTASAANAGYCKNLHNSGYSNGVIYYRLEATPSTLRAVSPGVTVTCVSFSNEITSFMVPSNKRVEISGTGLVHNLSGGVWYSFDAESMGNNITGTVKNA